VISDKGLIQALEGNYSGALSLYKKALTIDPYDYYTLSSIGRVLYRLHNYTGAIQYFDKALAHDPRDVYALYGKGLALYRLGNYSQALASYNSGLSLDPYMYDMLDTKALSLIKLGNLTDALSTLDAALALDPRDEYAFYNKALVLIELGLDKHNFGDMGAALENLDMALDINSDDKDALHMKTLLTQLLTSTYENTTYVIRVQYPPDWTVQGSNASGTPIDIATFVSPTGPDSNPTAGVSIYMDKLHNSTTTLHNYAHFVAFADYENRTSYFHAFKLLELSTNSSILAGKPAYTLIGTYELPSAGLQKLMEVGTIIGDKAYSVQYIADAPKYSSYFPAAQKIIGSLVINKSLGTGIGRIAV
jgi:tetratricopeptide (TPR) repeat protein